MDSRSLAAGGIALAALACGSPLPPTIPPPGAVAPVEPAQRPPETHLRDVRQLTFGGENAEAYWSFDGRSLVFQAHSGSAGCDQIYTLRLDGDPPSPRRVSTGRGATTCSYFLPGDQEIVYSSTHLAGDECPPKPDRSQGYVWPVYESYDIFRANADGSDVRRLTSTPGYDAEATVCPKDGSIVFTSVRDGDLELYRMDADGSHVKRLTRTPGYDGGAFFDRDCDRIVWRASRPEGEELEEYRRLLARGLVRPSKLELYVASADGSDARQVTYLGAAAFAPFFHPSGRRILFSSNHADPNGREFDLWAVDTDGTDLERITTTPGFDGFPMFSPDGRLLAFSSNRANAPGSHDTNVFVARWVERPPETVASAADRTYADVAWLADPARGGRGVGTPGLEAAGAYIEARFREIGLDPLGDGGSFREPFSVTTSVEVGAGTFFEMAGRRLGPDDFRPLATSGQGAAQAQLVLAGYGIRAKELGVDDYRGVDARGKIVVVRRFVPDADAFSETEKKRRFGDLRYKAWVARERGARALVVTDVPARPARAKAGWKPPEEARFPSLRVEGYGDAGIPVVVAKRAVMAPVIGRLERHGRVRAKLSVALDRARTTAFNVVGRLAAPEGRRRPGTIVMGAHYDHLGLGGPDSLAPEAHEPHLGADDNASGVAALLEAARRLAARRAGLARDVAFVAFSGEESGLIGSTHLTREPPPGLSMKSVAAMVNMDMVGRLRENRLSVLGSESAQEWGDLVQRACREAGVKCKAGGDGYGPSDQTAFYAAGVPVLHLFTGAHGDYHKPTDSVEKINAAGIARVAQVAAGLAVLVGQRERRLTYRSLPSAAPGGDLRSFNASLGSVPDYTGPPDGRDGVLLAGTRPGGAADRAGMRRGDVLVRLGAHTVRNVRDLMYALNASKPGQTVTAVVVRDGKEVSLEVTFQERKSRRR